MQVLIWYLRISKTHPTMPMSECGPLSRTAGECQPRRIREYCVIKGLWFDQRAYDWNGERMNYRRCYLSTDRTRFISTTYILREYDWLYCPFLPACLVHRYFAFEVPFALNLFQFFRYTTDVFFDFIISVHIWDRCNMWRKDFLRSKLFFERVLSILSSIYLVNWGGGELIYNF